MLAAPKVVAGDTIHEMNANSVKFSQDNFKEPSLLRTGDVFCFSYLFHVYFHIRETRLPGHLIPRSPGFQSRGFLPQSPFPQQCCQDGDEMCAVGSVSSVNGPWGPGLALTGQGNDAPAALCPLFRIRALRRIMEIF